MQNYVSTYGPNPMLQFWHLCKEMEEAKVSWTRAIGFFEARDEIRCRKRGIQSNPIQSKNICQRWKEQALMIREKPPAESVMDLE
jgi:hypothetical protein